VEGAARMSCPICERDTDPQYRPFCSKRCSDVDLAKWLTGSYAIPAAPEEQADDDHFQDLEKPH
jgi:endogenous inhibitor of DNA gyrase (YacG/DUF329 family)